MTDPASPRPAIPAATLVILRDRADGPAEMLMVERARAMRFAGGALVFPGGRVDPGDVALAAAIGGDDGDDLSARIAAIRETIEEVGIAIGLDPLPSPDAVAIIRAALHAGHPLASALAEVDAAVDPDALTPFARWRPAHANIPIFDTRFYLARLPADAAAASVDETENVRLFWATAASVLADADAGRSTLIYPTRRNLERLARYRSYDDAVADAARHPIRTITPWAEKRDGATHLCIPDDLGYPVTSEVMASAMRG